MDVTVEVVGEDTHEVHVDDDATYADVVVAAGYSPQAVSVLVDGTTVPADRPVDTPRIRLLRLIKGGGHRRPRG